MTVGSDSPGSPPVARMSLPARLRALREFHTGPAIVRDLSGPVVRVPVGPRLVVPPYVLVTSPQGAHDVLASSNDTMDKLTQVHIETRLIGANIFNLPYKPWKPQRRTLQPLFTKQHVATFAGHMAAVADERASSWGEGDRIDLDHDMHGLTLRVLGRSLFGVTLDEHASDLGPSIQQVLNYGTSRGLRPVRAPPGRCPPPRGVGSLEPLAKIHSVIEEAIASCQAHPARDCELVRLLLAARDPDTGRPLTHDEVVSDLAVFLIAGHDTTSTTLTYALWALGHHPEYQDRLAEEVGQLGDRALTVQDVPALPFTVQVIHEALRLCPPAAAIARLATRDTVVDGFRIERGTNVLVGIYALHRDPALWDAPDNFDPDRSSADRSRGRDRWQFLPFGAGARSCIGDHFAMLEATLGLASIVRRRRVTSLDPTFPLALPFTMTADGPILARVERRRQSRRSAAEN